MKKNCERILRRGIDLEKDWEEWRELKGIQ